MSGMGWHSDLDYHATVNGPCNADVDARQDEAFREQQWASLAEKVRATADRAGWTQVFAALKDAHRQPDASYPDFRLEFHLAQFASAEGWPDTLAVISRAMREQQRECEARR